MRFVTTINCIITAVFLFSAHSAIADSSRVMSARFNLGDAMAKLGILTNSFTEQGMKSPNVAGAMAAQDITAGLDKAISDGLQRNNSCADIENALNTKIANVSDGQKTDYGVSAKNAQEAVKAAIRSYVEVRCKDLTE